MSRPGFVELPQESPAIQGRRKIEWNRSRPQEEADFFTMGYSGRDINNFVEILERADIQTLLDIRHSANSIYKPAFSKSALNVRLESSRITYQHIPQLGVPREIRIQALDGNGRDSIWSWYDKNVIGRYIRGNLHRFLNSVSHPVALMCLELDPTSCHRHRLALALERLGLKSHDL